MDETFYVEALYDYQGQDAGSLSFRHGARIEVLTQLSTGWWDGVLEDGQRGWFPCNYVQSVSDERTPTVPGPAASTLSPNTNTDEWAAWLPRVTSDGRIVYYNPRSGAVAADIPDAQPSSPTPDSPITASAAHNPRDSLTAAFYTSFDNNNHPASLSPPSSQRSLSPPLLSTAASTAAGATSGATTTAATTTTTTTTTTSSLSSVTNNNSITQPPLPALADVHAAVHAALADMLHLAMPPLPLRPTLPADEHAAHHASRLRLAQLTLTTIAHVRNLLHALALLDPLNPSTSSSSSHQHTHSLSSSSLSSTDTSTQNHRSASRRVISILSKLILSVRASWGVLPSSAHEEAIFLESLSTPNSTPTDIQSAKQARSQVLRLRQDTIDKRRQDISAAANELAEHVSRLVHDFESTSSSNLARKRILASFKTSPAALLLPGGGSAGSWRGNGFVTLSPHLPYPDQELNLASIHPITSSLNSLSSRASNLIKFSSSSPSSSTSNAVLKRSSTLLSRLSKTMAAVENVDIAAHLELDFDYDSHLASSMSSSSTTSLHTNENENSKSPPTSQQVQDFNALVIRSRPLLASFEALKQKLYDNSASLLLAVQSRLLLPQDPKSVYPISCPSPAQPFSTLPYNLNADNNTNNSQNNPSPTLKHVLQELVATISPFASTLLDLAQIAESQSKAHVALRRSSVISKRSLPKSSSSSYTNVPSSASKPRSRPSPSNNNRSSFLPPPHDSEESSADDENFFFPGTTFNQSNNADVNSIHPSSAASSSFNHTPSTISVSFPRDSSSFLSEHSHSSWSSSTTTPVAQPTPTIASSSSSSFTNTSTSSSATISASAPARSASTLLNTNIHLHKPSSSSSESSTASSSRLQRQQASLGAESISRSLSDMGITPAARRSDISEIAPFTQFTPDQDEHIDELSPTASAKSPSKLRKLLGDDAPSDLSALTSRPLSMLRTESVDSLPIFEPDFQADEISFNMEGQIRGATLNALVAKLTTHEHVDRPFNTTFLMTYRTFTTSAQLFDLLVQRYLIEPPLNLDRQRIIQWEKLKGQIVRIRVVNIFKLWIEQFLYDDDEAAVIRAVIHFATTAVQDSVQAQQLVRIAERRRDTGAPRRLTASSSITEPPPFPLLPRNPRRMKLTDVDSLEVARQLTILDSKLFCRIQAVECLGKAWPKVFGSDTPNLKAMIDMNNAITRWVAESILKQNDVKKRANTIKYFVTVAERCRSLQNYSTLMQIIAGLNSTSVHRLRRTWETVSGKTVASLESLKGLMSPTKNFSEYREAIRMLGPPCIPFMGVYLTDWTFIGDGNSDMLREKQNQINFNKRQKASEHIQQIQLYQSVPYNLAVVPSISSYIENCLGQGKDEQTLYQMSLKIEPRERDDEKIARLLSESGFL